MKNDKSWIQGKTALITGASKRIGKAIAVRLAQHGVNVVVHYNESKDEALNVAEQLRDSGVKAWTVNCNLSIPEESEDLLPKALEKAGKIHILINNASIFTPSKLHDLPLDDLYANMQVNAIAPLLIARKFAEQEIDSAVINFLDTKITEYDKEHVAYHISKRMLHSLTRMMALEFAPEVRVNAIGPGLILPPPGKDIDYLLNLAPTNPLNRIGNPQGITDAVVFLLNSEFVTGQVIFVDGGYHMKGYTYG